MKLKKIALLIAAGGLSAPVFATNGMNMEGYGPIATAMGGASFAYDNGNAGMINNPATLGFMASGTSRFDIAIGGLHPDVKSQGQDSSATAFYMPAFGYIRKDGNLSWGAGMMAQGGMGTEYSSSAVFGSLVSMGQTAVADPGLKNKSEVGVGRLIFPIAYSVSPDLNIGGSIDYVWDGMDIKWLIDGSHFADMMPAGLNPFARQTFGTVGNTMVTAFGGAMGAGQFTNLNYGYFDFDTSSRFSQKAKGSGWAGNLGFTYKVSPALTIGGVYHAKTSLGDMKTGNEEATASFAVSGGLTGAGAVIPVKGQIVVKNFQWPETYGIGMSYLANDQWQVVADYKRINWAAVMKSFKMSFIASGSQTGMAAGFAGTQMDLDFFQNWKNQDVYMIGAAYKKSDALTVRFGVNLSSNPIPNGYVTPLFPAIIENHLMAGFGYQFDKASSLDMSLTYAPKVTVTNNWSAAGGTSQSISHSQTNWQLMYSRRF